MKFELFIFIGALLLAAGAGFSEAAFRIVITYHIVVTSCFLLKVKL